MAELLRETEVEAIDAGALRNARYIEPEGMLLVQLAYSQHNGTDSHETSATLGIEKSGGSSAIVFSQQPI